MFQNGSCLPNIPYPFNERVARLATRIEEDAKRVIFVGGMNYFPNQQAVIFYVKKVWPRILKEIPDAEFRVIGVGCPLELKETLESIVVTRL